MLLVCLGHAVAMAIAGLGFSLESGPSLLCRGTNNRQHQINSSHVERTTQQLSDGQTSHLAYLHPDTETFLSCGPTKDQETRVPSR